MPYDRSECPSRYEILAGQLYRYNHNNAQRVRPWGERAGCWTRYAGADWLAYTPGFRVPQIEAVARDSREPGTVLAAQFLLDAWPASACDVVRELPGPHWDALQLINLCGKPAAELLASNPALGVLVSAWRQMAPQGSRFDDSASLKRLVLSRRRDIAAEFGFPKSEATVRLLAGVRRESVDVDMLRQLRRTLWGEAATQRRPTSPPNQTAQADRFPPSPLPETPAIRAITTAADLRREGLRMHHCAGSYAGRATRGVCFFYRVLAPERATLAIERGPRGWRILDLKLACNRRPDAATLLAVRRWLAGPVPTDVPCQLSFDFGAPA
jgi:hypothetical protein